MFEAIKEKVRRLKQFNQDKVLQEILDKDSLKAQIIDLNQKQLYEEGIQADGTSTGQYAAITINVYKPIAAAEGRDGRTDHVTFKDTGHTYNSMEVESTPEGIRIVADDEHAVFERMKAEEALGLTSDSLSEIIPEIRDDLVSKVRQALNG